MDDLGRPARRQASSDRRSSSQRERVRPRPRASNQSLQSAGRPQESATFTSFEPFSPPNNPNGLGAGVQRDDASVRSDSSSKRSRSIFAPNRANSVVESSRGAAPDHHASTSPAAAQTPALSGVSQASQSLMHAVLDLDPEDGARPPLFQDNLNTYRSNPRVLAEASHATLYQLMRREGGATKVVKVLASDLADRDAEVTRLRKRNEELASLFKDHLTAVHSLSRLDADLAVRSLSPGFGATNSTSTPATLEDDIHEAHDNAFGDGLRIISTPSLSNRGSNASISALSAERGRTTQIPGNDASSARQVPAKPSRGREPTPELLQAPRPRSGFLGMFGGSRTVRAAPNNRQSIAGVLSLPASNVKGKSQSMRSPSLAMSPRPESVASAPPLEMEQKIESEDLPPPLLSMKLIKIIFRNFTADNYGFIIDESRVIDWLLNPATQGAFYVQKHRKSSIATRASSIASVESGLHQQEPDEDLSASDAEGQRHGTTEESTSHWYEYLTLGGSKLALLSRLPIQLQGPAEDDHDRMSTDELDSDRPKLEDLIDPADFTEKAEHLRDEISEEYTSLQTSRNQSWTRFWAKVEAKSDGGNRLSRLFTGGSQPGARGRAESMSGGTIGIASLALSTFEGDFIRFVLDGIPMKLRPKVWLECAEASIHYSPKAYEQLASTHAAETAPTYLHDIQMDAPRTLTNNVYFRDEKNQAELSNLLGCFATRNKDVGYCQGFNIIAGYLLLAMPTTEQAFWVFCFLIESVFPHSYFTAAHDWRGPRADIIVLRGYIRQLMPRLAAHLDELEIPDEQTVPINWFLTAFASTLSVEALFRAWDVVLSLPGQQLFLLKVAIALLKVNEERLLAISSASALYACLDRGMNAGGVSIDGLIQASWHLRGIVTPKRVDKQRHVAGKQLVG
ncbi:hypothetical protein MBLNU459_g1264t1 [Dothideomycetes sp. NU459]